MSDTSRESHGPDRLRGAHGAGWLARLLTLATAAIGALLVAGVLWLLVSCPLWWPGAPRLPLPAWVELPAAAAPTPDPATAAQLEDIALRHLRAEVELRFAGPWRQWLYVFFALQELALLVVALLLLRHVVSDLSRGNVFTHANARRLRWLGLVLLVEAIYAPGISSALSQWLTGGLTFAGEPLRIDWRQSLGGAGLASAWIVLVLSEAFRQGADLREEQSLTV